MTKAVKRILALLLGVGISIVLILAFEYTKLVHALK
jgi:uncharacterized membrane protein YgaE (UPF0421/DUF939 family)